MPTFRVVLSVTKTTKYVANVNVKDANQARGKALLIFNLVDLDHPDSPVTMIGESTSVTVTSVRMVKGESAEATDAKV